MTSRLMGQLSTGANSDEGVTFEWDTRINSAFQRGSKFALVDYQLQNL
jgi:hypothetical protein